MDDRVEAVAAAIYESDTDIKWVEATEYNQEESRIAARAAIEANDAWLAGAGWKTVPRKLDTAMGEAADDVLSRDSVGKKGGKQFLFSVYPDMWEAMLDAAPEVE